MLTWDKPTERYYHHGLDRGVLYPPGGGAVAWNGLQSFDEGSESPATTMYYRDGVVYLADADASDFSGKLTAIYFPDEFSECLGMPEATDGLYVDNQKPKRFDFAYRTLIGSGGIDDRFGYQIHLVYQAMASVSTRSRQTLGEGNAPTSFDFDIVCTPVKLPGYRPTAHYVIDTRGMSPSTLTQIENLLYGVGATPGRMPTPTELFDIMNFGDAIRVTSHADGTFTVEASSDNIQMLDFDHFQLNNINATAPNAAGEYVISDGGTTTVTTG